MGGSWAIPGGWLLHSAAGGGLLLLLAWVLARRTRQPARRQRLGDYGVAAALLAAVLSLGPAWVVVSLGLWPEQPPAEGKAPLASIREDEALGGRGSRRAMPKAGQKPRPPE